MLFVEDGSSKNNDKKESKVEIVNLTDKEKIEFSRLLFEISKSRNIKIEDTRGRPGGGLFASLLSKPGHVEAIKLRRLVELGLEIWPGRNFLN